MSRLSALRLAVALSAVVAVGACDPPVWRAPPPAEEHEALHDGIARVLGVASRDREMAFEEALHPGTIAAWRRDTLATGDMTAFRDVGEDLFARDAPWRGGPAAPVLPLHTKDAPAVADATRCSGCHHQGGLGGSGSFADLAFFDATGDDVWSARRRLPRMLAGAAALELAVAENPDLHPFGWKPGGPRRLVDMVRRSADIHMREAPSAEEVDAITTFIALLPLPRRASPPKESLVLRAERGAAIFAEIGCAACHTERMTVQTPILRLSGGRALDLSARLSPTGKPPFELQLFSDLKVHPMGDRLAEGEGPQKDAFVTAPLWGLASRSTFLHDGRASTADEAILAHGGEAAAAREAYAQLQERQSDLALFLATLGRPVSTIWVR